MTPASELLCAFVLDRSREDSAEKRIALYRALAATLPENCPQFGLLTEIADDLEEIERRSHQLRLDLGGDQDGNENTPG